MKQIKGLVCKDLAASKTDRQTVKKLFKGESMRAVTLLNTLLNQILRESEHFFIHTERKKELCFAIFCEGRVVRARADYRASCEKDGLVLRAGLLGNIAKYNMFPCFDIIFA